MQQTPESWSQMLARLSLDRWLPQSYGRRATVLVLAVIAGILLLLHNSATWPGPAALSDTFNRISSPTYSRFTSADYQLNSALCSPACPCACRPWKGPYGGDLPTPVISNCGPMADRRGPHQNVIAYTFFGTNVTAYLSGVTRNADLAMLHYPGWTMRVYYDGAANLSAWDETACDVTCRYHHVDLCDVRHLPGLGDISNQTATIWRFAVIADESVDRFLMRDLDSVLTERERSAVDEWLKSNKTFHSMRDHPWHGSKLLAGMWGGWNRYNEKYRPMRQQMLQAPNPLGAPWWDQRLLERVLWPELVRTGDLVAHDSYQCERMPMTRPWPTRRHNRTEFVGSQFTRVTLVIPKKCPLACRPPKHMDWDYC